jgi:hypothetical protein
VIRLNRSILMLGSLGILLAGCAANPAVTAYDQYGNPISAYGTDPYGSSYGGTSTYGSDPYGSSGSYSSGSDSYSGSSGSYGDTSGSYSGGSFDDASSTSGSSYPGASPSPSASPTPAPPAGSLDDRPVLSATLLEVKESGLFGMGKITAKVEVENPGNITLSGKLRVLFTDNGDPTPNAYVRKVTLHPQEKQTLTFTANSWRLDDAEVTIETDEQPASKSGPVN